MNQITGSSNALSLLGYTGALSSVLLTATAVAATPIPSGSDAVVVPSISVTQPAQPQRPDIVFSRPSAPTAAPADSEAAMDLFSDAVGDRAIETFKCDCPPCRLAVVQTLPQPSSGLPSALPQGDTTQ